MDIMFIKLNGYYMPIKFPIKILCFNRNYSFFNIKTVVTKEGGKHIFIRDIKNGFQTVYMIK